MQLQTGDLRIENVQLSDAGSYWCTASSQVGQNKQNVKLVVKSNVADKAPKCLLIDTSPLLPFAVV